MFMFITLLCIAPLGLHAWVNQYDQQFTFVCPPGQGIRQIESHHDNHYEDRLFNFQCAMLVPVPLGNCEWSGYVNAFDGPINYQCHGEGVLAGVESYHDNNREDRRFSFYCCRANSYVAHGCHLTPYVNSYDGDMNYRVPDGFGIKGIHSIHDNNKEDRIFQFDICHLDPVSPVGK